MPGGPEVDAGYMRTALGLAQRAVGRCWPNPAVGCVLVREGRVVGRGWTQAGGRPHGETEALGRAGAAARGATAYVSLEPCAHHGRTPPCTDALIAAGVARVVVPLIDPDPRVAGQGVAALREAGVQVDIGCLADEAAALNRGFLTRIATGRPMTVLKLAQSLDGRIATASGESRWITGPLARREVHLMRARSDAVLIGARTARADDPMLDVRELGLEEAAPVRIVVAGGLSLPVGGRLGASARRLPLWLCHHGEAEPARRAAWTEAGATLIEVPFQPDGLMDMGAMMQALGGRGLTRVLCEGGGTLAAALLAADLVDEVVTYFAGLALGAEGTASVGALPTETLALAPRFRLTGIARVGGDLRATWQRP
jgi:diaminohydroxyphosphoribosylaminopyrimidine deaminase / 5-amino-6-(5-phosphoribosylamino)uracil reductase